MIVSGIDPGLDGAIAFLDTETNDMSTFGMPTLRLSRATKAKRDIDAHALARLFWERHAGHVFVEEVASMPGQGVSSMFAFGKGYGIVLGVLAAVGVPMTLVSPRRWKSRMGLGASKDGARARASQLYPAICADWALAKNEGRAEAALIALFGYQIMPQIVGAVAPAGQKVVAL